MVWWCRMSQYFRIQLGRRFCPAVTFATSVPSAPRSAVTMASANVRRSL